MKKDKFNSMLRDFARSLSPNSKERNLVDTVYQSINDLLWVNNCIQVGSYPRKTSITPVHDLDVLYFLWNWNENLHDPYTALKSLYDKIVSEYKNPTNYNIKVSLQTHSVTISYHENNEEEFGVDIVPAYIFGKNEFWNDKYKVPEIIKGNHKKRIEIYQKFTQEHKEMEWIMSDPRWYISIATKLDWESNWELRKSVKLIKTWKNNLCDADNNLKLKSFHLEQVITRFFQGNVSLDVFDVVFKFFTELPQIIWQPNQIADRANADKFIDDYLSKLTQEQKNKIKEARDCLLIKLENMTEDDDIWDLFEICFYKRKGNEKFLFDLNIPTLINTDLLFQIDWLLKKKDWFREYQYNIKAWKSLVDSKNSIRFVISKDNTQWDKYLRKVKNDNNCYEKRWEISEDTWKLKQESTLYPWSHYTECYSLLHNICIAKDRQDVVIY